MFMRKKTSSTLMKFITHTSSPKKSLIQTRYLSDSVTYSGGHASQGQGGYYGSGGARVSKGAPIHHPEAVARQADILALTAIMNEVEILETQLIGNTTVSSKTIEIKARLKKTISNPHVLEILNRLEIKGEPVWGLSAAERNLVRTAKHKYMSS